MPVWSRPGTSPNGYRTEYASESAVPMEDACKTAWSRHSPATSRLGHRDEAMTASSGADRLNLREEISFITFFRFRGAAICWKR